ncbi:AI-2E family transporter [Ferrimonas balearica]|uniref:AI-2E family transporter n=1 Tax=Ferrimonas balearica TaxID=44012 RepID=UPI001C59CF2A|nr:AI-2E family transporter [Ferrimonas balearica]MBW3164959.1 AI-2E family transporter [Ferrimonas balearica]MBY6106957.1 AI-2E family transporter [Ferrimonas balearica]
MSPSQPGSSVERDVIEALIKFGLILVLLIWCFQIIRPFFMPVLWGAILAVALYPLHLGFSRRLGDKPKLSATLITLIALAILLLPTFFVASAMISGASDVAQQLETEAFEVPPPTQKVQQWPVIGERAYEVWQQASHNLERFLTTHAESIKQYLTSVLQTFGGVLSTVALFTFSILISGVFLATGPACGKGIQLMADRLTGHAGSPLPVLAARTVRSVAQGVLGVAFIQAMAAGVGMALMGVPFTGLWTLLILILAIAQLPPILVLAPVIAYVFSVSSGLPAILFTVWSILVSASDGLLKPLLLGKGLNIPTLVILLGAIGGMMMSGIIGLFVGAVVLAVGYTLLEAWLTGEGLQAQSVEKSDKERVNE